MRKELFKFSVGDSDYLLGEAAFSEIERASFSPHAFIRGVGVIAILESDEMEAITILARDEKAARKMAKEMHRSKWDFRISGECFYVGLVRQAEEKYEQGAA